MKMIKYRGITFICGTVIGFLLGELVGRLANAIGGAL